MFALDHHALGGRHASRHRSFGELHHRLPRGAAAWRAMAIRISLSVSVMRSPDRSMVTVCKGAGEREGRPAAGVVSQRRIRGRGQNRLSRSVNQS